LIVIIVGSSNVIGVYLVILSVKTSLISLKRVNYLENGTTLALPLILGLLLAAIPYSDASQR